MMKKLKKKGIVIMSLTLFSLLVLIISGTIFNEQINNLTSVGISFILGWIAIFIFAWGVQCFLEGNDKLNGA